MIVIFVRSLAIWKETALMSVTFAVTRDLKRERADPLAFDSEVSEVSVLGGEQGIDAGNRDWDWG